MESIIIALDLRQVLSDAGATQAVDGVHGSSSCGSTKWSSAEPNQDEVQRGDRGKPCERAAEAQR